MTTKKQAREEQAKRTASAKKKAKAKKTKPQPYAIIPITKGQADAIGELSYAVNDVIHSMIGSTRISAKAPMKEFDKLAEQIDELRWRGPRASYEKCIGCNGHGWDEQNEFSETLTELLNVILEPGTTSVGPDVPDIVQIQELATEIRKLIEERKA